MTSNRIFSLNDVATDFAVEELEPRTEMQMLGLGADPGIICIYSPNGFEIILSVLVCFGNDCYFL